MRDPDREQQRNELHRAIWAIAEHLRGTVDGWDFKNYVLGTMFYRYLSEKMEVCAQRRLPGTVYARLPAVRALDLRQALVDDTGCFIPPEGLFCNVCRKAPTDPQFSRTLEQIFLQIGQSAAGTSVQDAFAGLSQEFDCRSSKLGASPEKQNETLCRLLQGVADMKLGDVAEHGIDAFGDAYEYLMTMYAGSAGKSGGEFFTPPEVSELLTRLGTVGKTRIQSVYDPACGSGSLLLQAAKVLGRDRICGGFYGQELNVTTYHLCLINMLLHDVGPDRIHIACEDTLLHPMHGGDAPFELIVSNPPYSVRWDADPRLLEDPRFAPAGVLAPRSKGDLAFVMHCLSWLSQTGTAAIVCFPGILYRAGPEKKIRQYLVEGNFIDSVIQLPANLFFGTTVATCILVLRKNRTDRRILFVDASGECIRVPNHNLLGREHMDRILETYANRRETPHFSHLAVYDEIVRQDWNLNVRSYVEPDDAPEPMDPAALEEELDEIVAREQVLRDRIRQIMKEMNHSDWKC